MAPEPSLTIEELAAATGLATSTLRLYQNMKLLAPPQRAGRRAFYGPDHVARVRLIRKLQEDGFSLAGIGQLVAAWDAGDDLRSRLQVERHIGLHQSEGRLLGPDEVETMFGKEPLQAAHAQAALALGLVELGEDGRLRLPHPRLLDIGRRLSELGIPLDDLLREYGLVQRATREVADRFVDLFEKHLWPQFSHDGRFNGDIDGLAELLGQLESLAAAVVEESLRIAVSEAARAQLSRQAGHLLAALEARTP